MRLFFILLLLIACNANAETYYAREEVKEFIGSMVVKHGFDYAQLESLFKKAVQQKAVLAAMQAPAEKRKKWLEYRPIFINEKRIQQGVKFWKENEEILRQAQEQYGVPAEIIVSIIGVETYYGRITGKHKVFDSLVTLGFDYPRRAKFFLGELEHYLLLCNEEGFDPLALLGSYAGAMGVGQFISSSYRNFAVDQDQDNKRDLWNSRADIIGSIANYFKQHGWKKDAPVAVQAQLNGNAVQIDQTNRLKPSFSYQQLYEKGFSINNPGSVQEKVSFIVLDVEEGKEYWLGQHNFYVITRYNHSHMYAMAVYQLSQEIKKQWILTLSSTR